jgi:ParB-like chromosome segregation protein Spo0J
MMARTPKIKVEKTANALERLTVEYVPIEQCHANDYNPNRQSEDEHELLMRSIREDGFTQPIVVANDYTIVDGEHRWRAAATLGMTEIPVVVVPMDAAQARIATLRHNRARGSEDLALTAEVLRDMQRLGALDWAQDSLMLDDVEIQRLLDDVPAPDALAGAEFSGAWVPARGADGEENVDGQINRNTVASATPEAVAAQRAAEQKMAAAHTEEERIQIRRDQDVYRLVITFSGEQGALVRRVLGAEPAQKILTMCADEDAAEQVDAQSVRLDNDAA